MVTSGRPSRACSLAIRISAHNASSRPPPNAMPLIAAITGGGSAARRSNRAWPRSPQLRPNSSGVSAVHSLMSAPAGWPEFQPHRLGAKQTRVHLGKLGADPKRETRLAQHVALEVYARRDL